VDEAADQETASQLCLGSGSGERTPACACPAVRRVSGNGREGRVWIDNFRFERLDDSAAAGAVAEVIAGGARINAPGTDLTSWVSGAAPDSLVIDFHHTKEVGGAVIDWDTADYANSYDILTSDDGNDWNHVYGVQRGKPGRAYIPCGEAEGRFLKLRTRGNSRGRGAVMRGMNIKDPSFSSSSNNLYRTIAGEAPPGYFPKYFLDQQSYWTVVGVSGDAKEALMNEQGQIEVDRVRFSLEPSSSSTEGW